MSGQVDNEAKKDQDQKKARDLDTYLFWLNQIEPGRLEYFGDALRRETRLQQMEEDA